MNPCAGRRQRFLHAATLVASLLVSVAAAAQGAGRMPVIVDLDIGDDIDDSFALALVLASPEFELRGISTSTGDTALRARMVLRLLRETGRDEVPVRAGIATPARSVFTQARWASGPHRTGDASRSPSTLAPAPPAAASAPAGAAPSIDFLLAEASAHPGEITLLALGPLTNLAAALGRDPQAFRRFRRIVMMGGSVREGYRRSDYAAPSPPAREYNIVSDIGAAQAVFASGVPIVMMPLDATLVRLDDQKRAALFSHGSDLTDALTSMYHEWANADQPWASATPTLFDVVPVAWLLDPGLCPTTPLAIAVDAEGRTLVTSGAPNAEVCLRSDRAGVLDRLMRTLLR